MVTRELSVLPQLSKEDSCVGLLALNVLMGLVGEEDGEEPRMVVWICMRESILSYALNSFKPAVGAGEGRSDIAKSAMGVKVRGKP